MSDLLLTVFNRVVLEQPMDLKNEDLEEILIVNLGIQDLTDLPALREILLYYLGQWPKLYELKDSNRNPVDQDSLHYKDYKDFVKMKIDKAIEYKDEILKLPKTEKAACVDECMQTDNTKCPPFSIQIIAPPVLLSHMHFNCRGNDVLLVQQHKTPWNYDMDLKNFLNCPNVSVNISLGCFCLTRSNIHTVDRFMTGRRFANIAYNPRENYIEKLIDINTTELYTVETLQEFFNDFNNILGPNMTRTRIELNVIINEVLEDVRIHLDGKLYTNTSVIYESANTNYLRSKQDDQSSECFNYYEVFTPKMKLTFVHFFPNEESVGKFPLDVELENSITYGCNLCDKNFSSFNFALNHFRSMHVAEDDFICGNCREQVPFLELLSKRWTHCFETE